MSLARKAIRLGEALPWPDALSAAVIARLVDRTRRKLESSPESTDANFARAMTNLPIAVNTAEANTQHYEIPSQFFDLVLGPQRKYSCCLYDDGIDTLAAAEERALAVTAARAGLANGQRILELGCGWGSLSLWMARQHLQSQITSVSNSHSQREYILRQARLEGLDNVTVLTADMNDFVPQSRFDRVVSVEMFEHIVNWRPLLRRIRTVLEPDGLLFLHIFSHKAASYRFLTDEHDDWIAKYFFTGGIMPSHRLIRRFPDLFTIEQEWQWNGRNYERTARDWLANLDANSSQILEVLKLVYGPTARLWQRRWRLFFMATMGLFGHADGNEWGVSHYRLRPSL